MDERLGNILLVSSNLFLKYGIRSISMDDICREMGISKKTLYQYIDNKADLIKKILELKREESFNLIQVRCKNDLNAIDILLEISKVVSKFFSEAKPSILFDMQKYYPEILKAHKDEHNKNVFIGLKKNMEAGMEQGIYRSDLNVDLIAELYVKRLEEINNQEFLNKIKYSFKKIFEEMFDNHIRAISNEKGLEYYLKQKKS